MFARIKRRMNENKTKNELGRLSTRELNDIGVSRSEIPYIARKFATAKYDEAVAEATRKRAARPSFTVRPLGDKYFSHLERPL